MFDFFLGGGGFERWTNVQKTEPWIFIVRERKVEQF